jgi:hypothetical protein
LEGYLEGNIEGNPLKFPLKLPPKLPPQSFSTRSVKRDLKVIPFGDRAERVGLDPKEGDLPREAG